MTEERLLRTSEAAKRMGYSTRTLWSMRENKSGPAFVRLDSGHIRYRLSDIEAWESARVQKAFQGGKNGA